MQLLKSAQGKKASELIDKAIKNRDAGRIRYIKDYLYRSQEGGVCGMCIDGAIMRYAIGKKEFLKHTENDNGQPDYTVMCMLGLNENANPEQLTKLFKYEMRFPIPIYKAMYQANDKGISWEEIRDWLKSIGK